MEEEMNSRADKSHHVAIVTNSADMVWTEHVPRIGEHILLYEQKWVVVDVVHEYFNVSDQWARTVVYTKPT